MISDKKSSPPSGAPAEARATSAIVCQIGAREHYAIARALHRSGQLAELITDIWVRPGSAASRLPIAAAQRLRGRHHPELGDASVTHFAANALARAGASSLRTQKSRWDGIVETNSWFQARAARRVEEVLGSPARPQHPVVIAYSYAALQILEAARRHGARTVLCQIDGGEAEARLIERIAISKDLTSPDFPHQSYWSNWHRECEIADRIVVNSVWSRTLLEEASMPVEKIVVAPVIFRKTRVATAIQRKPVRAFSRERPLHALFLGTLTVRKGIDEVLSAARMLLDRPVKFWLVGNDNEGRGAEAWDINNVERIDRVPRDEVFRFYREADVFLFPTHSDGFGLTQIEAMSEGLPLIVSKKCARVVEHGKTGLVLEEVSPDALVRALHRCLADPVWLKELGEAARAAAESFEQSSTEQMVEAILHPEPRSANI